MCGARDSCAELQCTFSSSFDLCENVVYNAPGPRVTENSIRGERPFASIVKKPGRKKEKIVPNEQGDKTDTFHSASGSDVCYISTHNIATVRVFYRVSLNFFFYFFILALTTRAMESSQTSCISVLRHDGFYKKKFL